MQNYTGNNDQGSPDDLDFFGLDNSAAIKAKWKQNQGRKVGQDPQHFPKFKKNFLCPEKNPNKSLSQNSRFLINNVIKIKNDENLILPPPFDTWENTQFPHQVLGVIQRLQFQTPTIIQQIVFPMILSGYDVIGIAQTGSGKTFAYLLPGIIHLVSQKVPKSQKCGPQMLIMSPTRELAMQIDEQVKLFAPLFNIRTACVYGGDQNKQKQAALLYDKPNIIIATPGRLLDFLRMGKTTLDDITYLVIDEADRLLDMGFEDQLRDLVGQIRQDRQTVFFSATWPRSVRELAVDFCSQRPVYIQVGQSNLTLNKNIQQEIIFLFREEKLGTLFNILDTLKITDKVLIFAETKQSCEQLSVQMTQEGYYAVALHGDKSQTQRDEVLREFKKGDTKLLCATDLASRGLDLQDITVVINFDFPKQFDDYIHRIGRTGRAEKKGRAFSFITYRKDDPRIAVDLIRIADYVNVKVDREELEQFRRGQLPERQSKNSRDIHLKNNQNNTFKTNYTSEQIEKFFLPQNFYNDPQRNQNDRNPFNGNQRNFGDDQYRNNNPRPNQYGNRNDYQDMRGNDQGRNYNRQNDQNNMRNFGQDRPFQGDSNTTRPGNQRNFDRPQQPQLGSNQQFQTPTNTVQQRTFDTDTYQGRNQQPNDTYQGRIQQPNDTYQGRNQFQMDSYQTRQPNDTYQKNPNFQQRNQQQGYGQRDEGFQNRNWNDQGRDNNGRFQNRDQGNGFQGRPNNERFQGGDNGGAFKNRDQYGGGGYQGRPNNERFQGGHHNGGGFQGRGDNGGRFQDRGDNGGGFYGRGDGGGRFQDRGDNSGGFQSRGDNGGRFQDRGDNGGRFQDRGDNGRFQDRGGDRFQDRGADNGGRFQDRDNNDMNNFGRNNNVRNVDKNDNESVRNNNQRNLVSDTNNVDTQQLPAENYWTKPNEQKQQQYLELDKQSVSSQNKLTPAQEIPLNQNDRSFNSQHPSYGQVPQNRFYNIEKPSSQQNVIIPQQGFRDIQQQQQFLPQENERNSQRNLLNENSERQIQKNAQNENSGSQISKQSSQGQPRPQQDDQLSQGSNQRFQINDLNASGQRNLEQNQFDRNRQVRNDNELNVQRESKRSSESSNQNMRRFVQEENVQQAQVEPQEMVYNFNYQPELFQSNQAQNKQQEDLKVPSRNQNNDDQRNFQRNQNIDDQRTLQRNNDEQRGFQRNSDEQRGFQRNSDDQRNFQRNQNSDDQRNFQRNQNNDDPRNFQRNQNNDEQTYTRNRELQQTRNNNRFNQEEQQRDQAPNNIQQMNTQQDFRSQQQDRFQELDNVSNQQEEQSQNTNFYAQQQPQEQLQYKEEQFYRQDQQRNLNLFEQPKQQQFQQREFRQQNQFNEQDYFQKNDRIVNDQQPVDMQYDFTKYSSELNQKNFTVQKEQNYNVGEQTKNSRKNSADNQEQDDKQQDSQINY